MYFKFFYLFFKMHTTCKTQEHELKQKLADNLCNLQTVEEKLGTKTLAMEKACKTIQYLLLKVKTLESKINRNQGTATGDDDEDVNVKEVSLCLI